MGNLSPEEEAKIKKDAREEFDKVDTDKSGLIDKNEFRKILEKVAKNVGGKPPKEEDYDEVFKQFDKDNSGQISFDEAYQDWVSFATIVGLSKN